MPLKLGSFSNNTREGESHWLLCIEEGGGVICTHFLGWFFCIKILTKKKRRNNSWRSGDVPKTYFEIKNLCHQLATWWLHLSNPILTISQLKWRLKFHNIIMNKWEKGHNRYSLYYMSLIYLVILAEGELNDGHSYIECGRELSLLHGTPLEWGDDEALYKKKEKNHLDF